MLLTETLGIDQFQSRVKIYATDLDDEALLEARQATYSEQKVQDLTEEQRQAFFEARDGSYTFRKDLRRSVILGCHDLVQDAPISKIDLLVCRNTLMYFNAETQQRILNRFHFALRDTGFLFLGKAEMMMSYSNTFVPVQLKSRIFKKVLQPNNIRNRLLIMAQTGNEDAADNLSDQVRLRDAAFDNGPIARVVIERNGQLSQVNALARSLFNLSQRDVGRPLQDLEISYRPLELRGYIDHVRENRRGFRLTDISWTTPQGSVLHLEVQIEPLLANGDTFLGTSVDFIDVTGFQRLQNELEHSTQELEMAYEELQSTNEELETTNEELQSSNEELETTNEELETMNEELQSTNEELQTVNDELQRSSDELNQNNAFLECVFNSLNGGVVVVNPDFQVQIWTNKAHDLWGLRPEEAVGQNFLNLDIGLPVAELRQPIRNCLASSEDSASEAYLDAINRRGRSITCRISCTPLVGTEQTVQGVILIMEEQER
jgi:two-component system CheB/CheR fusion protein